MKLNLVEDPWIKVTDNHDELKTVSLIDVWENANNYRGLAGEMQTQVEEKLDESGEEIIRNASPRDIRGIENQNQEEKNKTKNIFTIYNRYKLNYSKHLKELKRTL